VIATRAFTLRDLTLSLSKGEVGAVALSSGVLMLCLSKHEDGSITLSGQS
jgi:hypothetical protein